MKATPPENYVTPPTTDKAYRFGRSGGFFGFARLSHAQFVSALETPHPYPHSLYRAYRRGFDEGRAKRRLALAKLVKDEVKQRGDGD